jgi:diacylglycerol kinase (ATP)
MRRWACQWSAPYSGPHQHRYGLTAYFLWLLLIATEALNTAIEVLVDHVSPNWSEAARDAKDLGSLAVMALLWANGVFVVYVLMRCFA